ncbi:unnamed protein product [Effrenium voratum]|uniref:Uncharacterized protein n=1 Tax=Effrenium voratum TaxID=2562239 RepID=A0AA36J4E3_9DINO|nr:unnamed protein product [Effrenium voratum]CAJ1399407.1 unnamed protein product [Effrenium voratum]CAJ1436458.1 unnamed protein product [Effrenium voratum]
MMDMKRRARSLLAVAVGACVCMHFGADYNDFEGAFVGGVQASRSSLLASSTATAESKQSSMRSSRTERGPLVQLRAAKKATGDTIMHGDTVYIKVMTGRYVGELDGTTKLEWVKARGTKKDKEHALTIEKMNNRDEPIKNGDVVMFVMPSGVHMDVLGSAVRARYYDPRGEWQKITIVKQDGGEIYSGDQIFLRGHQGEYLDANPLERAPDGEVKARWRDEGEWQVMYIEK